MFECKFCIKNFNCCLKTEEGKQCASFLGCNELRHHYTDCGDWAYTLGETCKNCEQRTLCFIPGLYAQKVEQERKHLASLPKTHPLPFNPSSSGRCPELERLRAGYPDEFDFGSF